MRYLKPHFYDQFTCTAGDCPDTCCAGWQIVIDEDSLERYGKEQGEFGKRLYCQIKYVKYLPFVNFFVFLYKKSACRLYFRVNMHIFYFYLFSKPSSNSCIDRVPVSTSKMVFIK